MSPRQGVKIYKSLSVVDKFEVSVCMILVSVCRLASSRHGFRQQNLISHVFPGSGHVKEGLSV